MNRQEKSLVIESLKNEFVQSKASFVVTYKGLTVDQMQSLRKELRTAQSKLQVAKGRLIKRAVEGAEDADQFAPYLKDQIGIVFAGQEPTSVAKVLHDFSKKNESLKLVAGYYDARVLTSDAVQRFALLPSKEVLLAQLCGTLNAPISGFVRVLNMQTLRLLWTLKAVAEKKEQA